MASSTHAMERRRTRARAMLAIASLSFVAGGVIIYLGERTFGDALMIVGGGLLLVGALLLARTRTPQAHGGEDAR